MEVVNAKRVWGRAAKNDAKSVDFLKPAAHASGVHIAQFHCRFNDRRKGLGAQKRWMPTLVRHCIEKARTQIRANWSPRGCEVVMRYDLIVAGGGIAGASLQQRMAKNSAHVLQNSTSRLSTSLNGALGRSG